MKMIVRTTLLFLISVFFVSAKDIISIPEEVDFGDCAIPGKAQYIDYNRPITLVNNTEKTIQLIRCRASKGDDEEIGNLYSMLGVFSEYFVNNRFIFAGDTLRSNIEFRASILTDSVPGSFNLWYRTEGDTTIHTYKVKLLAKTHLEKAIVVSPHNTLGFFSCNVSQDTVNGNEIVFINNFTDDKYLIDSVKSVLDPPNLFKERGFFVPGSGGSGPTSLEMPVALEPGDQIFFAYGLCSCSFGVSRANSIIYLHNDKTGDLIIVYDTVMTDFKQMPEFSLSAMFDAADTLKVGDSKFLNDIHYYSCAPYSYDIDSIIPDPIWKSGELEFTTKNGTFPTHLDIDSVYHVSVKFAPKDSGLNFLKPQRLLFPGLQFQSRYSGQQTFHLPAILLP